MPASLRDTPRPLVQQAKPELTTRDEGTHAELAGQGQGLAVPSLGGSRPLAGGIDFTKEPQAQGLMAAFLVRAGEFDGPSGDSSRLAEAASGEIAFAGPADEQCVPHRHFQARVVLDCPLEQR